MSILTIVAEVGEHVHRVTAYSVWRDDAHLEHTEWLGFCGCANQVAARRGVFTTAGAWAQYDLCPTCFPERLYGYGPHWPSPQEVAYQHPTDVAQYERTLA